MEKNKSYSTDKIRNKLCLLHSAYEEYADLSSSGTFYSLNKGIILKLLNDYFLNTIKKIEASEK